MQKPNKTQTAREKCDLVITLLTAYKKFSKSNKQEKTSDDKLKSLQFIL